MRATCVIAATLAGCQFVEEVRVDAAQVSWGGQVQVDQSFSVGEATDLVSGTVTMMTLDGSVLEEATQPNADNLGYWAFSNAPVGETVAIRIDGDPDLLTPMVWNTTVPPGAALWFTGALFAREPAIHQAYFDALDGIDGITATPLEDGTVAALWGEPLDPTQWAGVEIVVTDGAGQQAPVWRLAIDEKGQLAEANDGPIDLFIAPNLQPGTVTVRIGTQETTWPAQGGDMLSAIFYELETP